MPCKGRVYAEDQIAIGSSYVCIIAFTVSHSVVGQSEPPLVQCPMDWHVKVPFTGVEAQLGRLRGVYWIEWRGDADGGSWTTLEVQNLFLTDARTSLVLYEKVGWWW